MAKSKPSADLADRIGQLNQQRRQHEQAIVAIDLTLARVGALLGSSVNASKGTGAKRGPKPGSKRRRRRAKFAVSGEASILAFVKENKRPTTQDLKKHWNSEGRGGTADNALSKLVKERKLKREALVGQRGSRYLLP